METDPENTDPKAPGQTIGWEPGPFACSVCYGIGIMDTPGREHDPDDEGVPCTECDGLGFKFTDDPDYP